MAEAKITYVTLKSKGEEPLDPFEIEDTLTQLDIKTNEVKELKSGGYLIAIANEDALNAVLEVTTLSEGTEVVVTRHASRNGCKRVFTCPQIKDKSEGFVLDRLAPMGVVQVEKRKASFIISFNHTTPPETIKIGVLTCRLAPFYRKPLLCRNCYIYGHVDKQCRNNMACRKCGGYHKQDHCNRPPKCRNCSGPHLPTNTSCPVWVQEVAITKLMVDNNLPGPKARDKYKAANKRSYIVPPRVQLEARKRLAVPPKAPEEPTPPKVQVPTPLMKRSAEGPGGPKAKQRKSEGKRALKAEGSEGVGVDIGSCKSSKSSGRKPPKAKSTVPRAASETDTGPVTLSAKEEYDLVRRSIFGSSEESEDERPEPAKPASKKHRRRTTT